MESLISIVNWELGFGIQIIRIQSRMWRKDNRNRKWDLAKELSESKVESGIQMVKIRSGISSKNRQNPEWKKS